MLVELGIVLDVLTNETEEYFRNCQTDILECTLFTDAGPNLTEVVLHIFTCEERITLSGCHIEETLVHSFHFSPFVSFFCRLFFRLSFCRLFLLSFFFCEFCFESSDRLFDLCLGCIVLCLVSFELCDLFFDCGPFFVRLGFFDRLLEFSLTSLELCILLGQRCQILFRSVNLLPEHQCFECHHGLLSSVFRPSGPSMPGVTAF